MAEDLTLDEAMLTGAFNAYEKKAWEARPALERKVEAAKAKVKSLNGDSGGSDNPAIVAAKSEQKAAEDELAALRVVRKELLVEGAQLPQRRNERGT